MRNIGLTMLAALLLCGCEGKDISYERNPEAERAATVSTEAWLRLVDSGRYSESWEQMAEVFKVNVANNAWQRYFYSLRKPLGKIISRKMMSCRYTKSLPKAPKGEYVLIQYSTSFEKKASTIETVTSMLDRDGRWRVSGYFIK